MTDSGIEIGRIKESRRIGTAKRERESILSIIALSWSCADISQRFTIPPSSAVMNNLGSNSENTTVVIESV